MREDNLFQRAPALLFRAISSNWLAITLLVMLMLLTLFGTLEQTDRGIYDVQKEYFESFVLVHDLGSGVRIPLLGGYLVMMLLTVNLVCGAVLRVRWAWSKLGVLIVHIGMILLFVSGFFIYRLAEDGSLSLMTNQSASEYQSDDEWEIAILRVDQREEIVEHLIKEDDFEDLERNTPRRFFSDRIPFDLVLSDFHLNCRPRPAKDSDSKSPAVDGVVLESLSKATNAAANVPGLHGVVVMEGTKAETPYILWGDARRPPVFVAGEGTWAVWLRKQRRSLPFTIRLDKFTRELYPGTGMPKVFRSDVTVSDRPGEEGRKTEIVMNRPLRQGGVTLYQSSYGPNQSVFSVVRNPADNYPLWATLVITAGLLVHFSRRLYLYLKAVSSGRRS